LLLRTFAFFDYFLDDEAEVSLFAAKIAYGILSDSEQNTVRSSSAATPKVIQITVISIMPIVYD
jgi:hypothetical protein